ncbi:MAG: sulfatase family protein [Flagellimonas sp.]
MKEIATVVLSIALSTLTLSYGQEVKPNVVIFLADDFGYGSANSFGASKGLVRTPNIEGLVANGMKFTNASTPASICSPTRYGILTGRYPWRSPLKFGVVSPSGPLLPNPDRVTIADMLKGMGYATAAIGKWHLGYGNTDPCDFTERLSPGPLDLGFDYHFAVPQNHGDKWGVYVENEKIYGLRSKTTHPYSRNFYGTPYLGFDAPQRVNKDVTQELTDKAVEWIKLQKKHQPFFLYFGAVAVHRPITPSDYMRGLSDCGPYGDFIQDLDKSLGEILKVLEYKGLLENTIFIFSSDNGGEVTENQPDFEENRAIAQGLKINGELRGDKHSIWEGGTRVPLAISWPRKIEGGKVSDQMVNLIDIFATVRDMTKGSIDHNKDVAPDSFSFSPTLLGSHGKQARSSMVTADVNGMHAIRIGDWKYIDDTPPAGLPEGKHAYLKKNFQRQLYNLAEDPTEQNNLFNEYQDKAEKMKKELNLLRKG